MNETPDFIAGEPTAHAGAPGTTNCAREPRTETAHPTSQVARSPNTNTRNPQLHSAWRTAPLLAAGREAAVTAETDDTVRVAGLGTRPVISDPPATTSTAGSTDPPYERYSSTPEAGTTVAPLLFDQSSDGSLVSRWATGAVARGGARV